ncbi:MAG: amidinotransferase [Blastocatellia bacterium AA13]|nr:MAG: amidinotransferase [Blastocatellia bacterium AA13]
MQERRRIEPAPEPIGHAVNSFNEWDPLEEVVVGVVNGACVPEWHVTLESTMPLNQKSFYRSNAGKPFPMEQVQAAERDLEGFVHILEAEGVVVRRPSIVNHARPFSTQDWSAPGGLYAAMPRDILLVIGNEIIESPMAWRSRYWEINAYRELLSDYFNAGAKWTSAPKPQLRDDLYDYDYEDPGEDGSPRYCITEFEPTFDAADFIRCGKDIFVQRSNVTNLMGINWLRRHLGKEYTIHVVEFKDTHPMHIDATFMPLAPGKVLINPERVFELPRIFRGWDALQAPEPCIPDDHCLYMTSKWINMNILMLDEERVIVEKGEETLIRAMKRWGFKPIPCGFRNFNSFGGSFHCATADVRRRGTLSSYF